ncbi:pickpocket protein 28-like [Leguminivora glycinivorella]|uniref:pickpocket protein 28-like n=1 Tax=Leguminivora glycinivorella TaxID=1035111 RepID=UPI00201050D6|nr:pickpocket protein 28-like [Leguminivora glycinivorella]
MMVYKSYKKFDTSAVAVTLKEHTVSVNEYPFPAITICSQARIRQDKYNYTQNGLIIMLKQNNTEGWTAEDYQKFHSALVLCASEDEITYNYTFLQYAIDMDIFFEVAPKHADIFHQCQWRNKVDCLNEFRPTLTADGVCHTFNNLATDDIFRKSSLDFKQRQYYLNTSTPAKGWSHEENYYSSENDTYPRRGRANGAREDLYILLKEVRDRDFGCDGQTRPGYKVYLHHPAELPQASLHSYAAQPGKTTSFAIKLDILDTAQELAGYAPDVRQCYFTSERYLQFFQKYTSSNCQLECLANYTIQNCGCVNFYMPRNESTAICKGDKLQCIEDALDQYADEEDLNDSESGRCGCLPECHEVNYDADVVVSKLDLHEFKQRYKQLQINKKSIKYDNGIPQEGYETNNSSNNFENDTEIDVYASDEL